jgi:thiol-disulfide isomerase/thioredoxin
MRGPSILTALLLLVACGGDGGTTGSGEAAASANAAAEPATVGYDLRRLRPTTDEPLAKTFERMHAQAKAEGKQVAMLFSAEWCERCRRLELELGNLHPAGDIAHVRILELVEEDWEQALRMNEFELLRQRWDATKGTYPLFVVLDAEGRKVEEMKEAIDRLEQAGQETTVATWFRDLRRS